MYFFELLGKNWTRTAAGDPGSLKGQITPTSTQAFSGFGCASQFFLLEKRLCQNMEIESANYLRIAEKKAVIPVT
jgi:hypothetical protein